MRRVEGCRMVNDDAGQLFGPHVLRQTLGTQLVRAGKDIVPVAEIRRAMSGWTRRGCTRYPPTRTAPRDWTRCLRLLTGQNPLRSIISSLPPPSFSATSPEPAPSPFPD